MGKRPVITGWGELLAYPELELRDAQLAVCGCHFQAAYPEIVSFFLPSIFLSRPSFLLFFLCANEDLILIADFEAGQGELYLLISPSWTDIMICLSFQGLFLALAWFLSLSPEFPTRSARSGWQALSATSLWMDVFPSSSGTGRDTHGSRSLIPSIF